MYIRSLVDGAEDEWYFVLVGLEPELRDAVELALRTNNSEVFLPEKQLAWATSLINPHPTLHALYWRVPLNKVRGRRGRLVATAAEGTNIDSVAGILCQLFGGSTDAHDHSRTSPARRVSPPEVADLGGEWAGGVWWIGVPQKLLGTLAKGGRKSFAFGVQWDPKHSS